MTVGAVRVALLAVGALRALAGFAIGFGPEGRARAILALAIAALAIVVLRQ